MKEEDFKKALALDVTIKFLGSSNTRITNAAKRSFIDGAIWAFEEITKQKFKRE